MKVLITGGTGFVGPHVVRAVANQGHDLKLLVRDSTRSRDLPGQPVVGEMTNTVSLQHAVEGVDAVVHLVAIRQGRQEQFKRVMEQGTRDLVAAAKDAGVKRFVLMSALGTSETTKDAIPYYGAKWQMEQDVQGSGREYTIFRPSFVFGRGGGALATFMRQVKLSPVVTVIGPGLERIQPIWVDDVAEYFARAVDQPSAANRTFEIGGPDVVTWNELYERIAKVLGKRRRLAHVPYGVARTGARLTGWLPGAPLTADQVAMIEAGDNAVSAGAAVETFQIPLVPLDEQIRRGS